MPIKGYNNMINKNECSNYLPPCATNALTLYMRSPSVADFSKRVTGCYFSINKQVLFLLKRQELTFANAAKPESNFCSTLQLLYLWNCCKLSC